VELRTVLGDITAQQVDAVVNAASPAMRGGGGVDGAIHAAAGPRLLESCVDRFPRGLEVGRAGWTPGFGLAARWVIHVVGPNYRAGQRDRSLLVSCYRSALTVADELGVGTIAFPLISAGIYGWPFEDAVDAAVDTLRSTPTAVASAVLVAYSPSAYDALSSRLVSDSDA
jgi:O-acetyl-ADP-ribose deacetylase (regulator of RNase III)